MVASYERCQKIWNENRDKRKKNRRSKATDRIGSQAAAEHACMTEWQLGMVQRRSPKKAWWKKSGLFPRRLARPPLCRLAFRWQDWWACDTAIKARQTPTGWCWTATRPGKQTAFSEKTLSPFSCSKKLSAPAQFVALDSTRCSCSRAVSYAPKCAGAVGSEFDEIASVSHLRRGCGISSLLGDMIVLRH